MKSFNNKLILGTMKINKNFKTKEKLADYLNYAHSLGIKYLHVSNEYKSYGLLKKSLNIVKKKNLNLLSNFPSLRNLA